ncbi:MAG: hypothetical protein LBE62_06160 [Azonexus sp.]|jgi:hypothetical protein|nr:hypothetical protein [Azonexus sp.]
MFRKLNLAAGLIGLSLLIIVLGGGIGALIGLGYFGESFVKSYPWIEPIWVLSGWLWILGWFSGILMAVARCPLLIRRVATRQDEKWIFSDALLAFGHASILLAMISIAFPIDIFYLCLMLAGFFYAIGVGFFGVLDRSKGREQPPVGN